MEGRGLGILHRSGSNLKSRVERESEERGSRFFVGLGMYALERWNIVVLCLTK